jgi:hypothetical protein
MAAIVRFMTGPLATRLHAEEAGRGCHRPVPGGRGLALPAGIVAKTCSDPAVDTAAGQAFVSIPAIAAMEGPSWPLYKRLPQHSPKRVVEPVIATKAALSKPAGL